MKGLRAVGRWLEDRTGLVAALKPQLTHPVPPDATWMYVFGSGTLLAFVLQVVTGIALAAVYVPSTNAAYESLRAINESTPLGSMLRGMHFFGASAMIALIGMHMIRVYLTGAYKFPRELNWLSGVLLLGLVLAMGFTGQLLRWDQNAVWSVVVGAEQAGRTPLLGQAIAQLVLGGPTLGADTLTRFFALHVLVLPGLIIGLVGLHLYLVLRNGISEPPRAGQPVDRTTYRSGYEERLERRGVPFWPHAIWRDAAFGVLVVAVVFALAWWFGPPALDAPPDPSLVHAHPRPDWYFLFYFALLALMPHGLED
ncbi:MAG: cytochrome bc complex cytochrome b subunit, partial [Myxococcales bacterium]